MMTVSHSHISILTLNVNGLNVLIKKTQSGKLNKEGTLSSKDQIPQTFGV